MPLGKSDPAKGYRERSTELNFNLEEDRTIETTNFKAEIEEAKTIAADGSGVPGNINKDQKQVTGAAVVIRYGEGGEAIKGTAYKVTNQERRQRPFAL